MAQVTTTERIHKSLTGEPQSTRRIAKKAGVSWNTAQIHLFKLLAAGGIEHEIQPTNRGAGVTHLWKLEGGRQDD